jgi:hypothetical protein
VIPWLKALFMDETAFVRFGRTAIFIGGQMLHEGVIPGLNGSKAWWIGPFVSAAALVLGAGDKNKAEP